MSKRETCAHAIFDPYKSKAAKDGLVKRYRCKLERFGANMEHFSTVSEAHCEECGKWKERGGRVK